uniref:Uncharacterized protein n=1 Tax=Setaria italica TaxID=4555 RepID=K3ZYT1_SETIT
MLLRPPAACTLKHWRGKERHGHGHGPAWGMGTSSGSPLTVLRLGRSWKDCSPTSPPLLLGSSRHAPAR